ncbi:transposase [Variovorax sp. WDL1]|nr:transposase [Variovorax sp. WDL1]
MADGRTRVELAPLPAGQPVEPMGFNQRFAVAGKRMRRIGIVALARRLAIALWRYLERNASPAGASARHFAVQLRPLQP